MSIKEHGLLVSVTINQPTKSRTDRRASEDVAKANQAKKDAGRYVKNLYPKHLTKAIEDAVAKARTFVARDTYPWKRGEYLLPVTGFVEFASEAGEIELEFQQAVTAFLNNWSNVLLEAQANGGTLFNANDYPDLDTLRRQFSMTFSYEPVTDNSDWRVQMQDEELQQLREMTEQRMRDKFQALAEAPAKDLAHTLDKLRATLSKPDRTVERKDGSIEIQPSIFKNSSFENVLAQCDKILSFSSEIMPSETQDLARRIRVDLPTPEQARAGAITRKLTIDLCSNWLAELADEPVVQQQDEELNPMGLTETDTETDTVTETLTDDELMAELEDMFGDDL